VRKAGLVLVAIIAASIAGAGGSASAPVAPADRPSVAVVGDSIGRDAEPQVRDEVERTNLITYYHAIAAGYTHYHLFRDPDGAGPQPSFLQMIRAADGPDIVVAELGTGDAFWDHTAAHFEADMRDFLDRVTPHVECVIWIEQKPSRNRAYPNINRLARSYNAVIHRVVRDYSDVRYLHYAAWTDLAGSPSPYFLADWLHLTNAGENELARLVGSAVRGCDPDLTSGPFWDVQDDYWAADAINWAAAEGIVDGYDNDTYRAVIGQFRPPVTRAQAADMLWRFDGARPEAAPHGWTDGVRWIRPALRWGRAAHVLTGFPDGTFRPKVPVTRGQLLGWLWRAAGRPGGFPPSGLPDSTPALRGPLNWAVANDIVAGLGGQFRRGAPVDRAQIAVWLHATQAYLDSLPSPSADPESPPPTTAVPPLTTVVPTTAPPATTTPVTTTLP
jgi:hypothetical protein